MNFAEFSIFESKDGKLFRTPNIIASRIDLGKDLWCAFPVNIRNVSK